MRHIGFILVSDFNFKDFIDLRCNELGLLMMLTHNKCFTLHCIALYYCVYTCIPLRSNALTSHECLSLCHGSYFRRQVSLVTFATYVLVNPDAVLDASTAFVSLSLINILNYPMALVPIAVSNIAQVGINVI